MATLFVTTPENVLMHLKNIYAEKELMARSTTKDFLAVRTEGKRRVRRKLKHYNLDAIVSVGYRVNSKRGVRFRQWATGVLHEHIVQGYTLNAQRLAERGVGEIEQAVGLHQRPSVRRWQQTDRHAALPGIPQAQRYAYPLGRRPRLANNAMVALALLVAESEPAQKDLNDSPHSQFAGG